MRHLRLLVITIATICVLALGAFALVNRPAPQVAPADDDIIIKGGSLEIDCGKNQGKDCFGDNTPGKIKPKHKDTTKHVTRVVVKEGSDQLYLGNFDATHQPTITITYK
ncbi:MAG: hypothetical protein ACREA9_16620 [Pyrinomonadaceae bacterium]